MINKKNKLKLYSVVLSSIITSSAIITPTIETVYASENIENLKLDNAIDNLNTEFISPEDQEKLDIYNSNAINLIVYETLSQFKPIPNSEHSRSKRGVASLATKLIKKFGKHYATKALPKLIYSKLPSAITKNISESAFIGGWNTYILMGPLDEVKDNVTNWLIKKGVWGWAAKSAGYIAQGVVWAII